MSHHRKGKGKSKRAPINFDEFKYENPVIEEPEEEEEEPRTEIDCCDRCLFASFGYICIYLAIFVIFFCEREHKYSTRDISYIESNLQLLDIAAQQPAQINTLLESVVEHKYPIHFVDTISNLNEKNMIVMDDRTDLSYPGIALKINTEMYQWVETQETIRKDGTTQTEIKYSYAKQWSNTFHDSSNFNQKDEYYNPQPTVSQLSVRNVWVDDIIVGQNKHVQFHLSKSLYTKLSKRHLWTNVTLKSAQYSEMEHWDIRNGYLFRPYDKAESYYAETQASDEHDGAEQTEEEEQENDDVSQSSDEDKERVRLDTPRTMIGDIRMAVFSLDTRGKTISYLGGVKYVDDWNYYVLIPWKSPNNHKFAMLQYGEVQSDVALQGFSDENVLKLWLSRVFSLVFMFIGFMILPNVLQTTVLMLRLPIGPIPFETWLKMIVAAVVVSVLLWITVVAIAYLVGIVHLALTFIAFIVVGLLMNNKAVPSQQEVELETKKKAN
eukprot:272100_1